MCTALGGDQNKKTKILTFYSFRKKTTDLAYQNRNKLTKHPVLSPRKCVYRRMKSYPSVARWRNPPPYLTIMAVQKTSGR